MDYIFFPEPVLPHVEAQKQLLQPSFFPEPFHARLDN